jgi:hypothetical protein
LVVTVMAFGQDYLANADSDPPPSPTAPVAPPDRTEVARIVEEQLREQELREQQQCEQRDHDAQQAGQQQPIEPDHPDGGGCSPAVR